MPDHPRRELLIASPRGFCAGVERAIDVVDRLLAIHGTPLYVRKEIVHNRSVVEDFKGRGVVFVDELTEVPDEATVVFSAHGISPVVRAEAQDRDLRTVDATCPLVTKVHREVIKHDGAGRRIVLIGHAGHDEVLGTMGEAPAAIALVTELADVQRLEFPADADVAYVTQTTLSVDETAEIVVALRGRFPNLIEPTKSDICYATQNRQDAVKELVQAGIDHLLVVGSRNSSNSRRLCELAERLGTSASLIDGPDDVDTDNLLQHNRMGLTAGASAPEHLVQAVVAKLTGAGYAPREVVSLLENVKFQLPRGLTAD